jgi:hypothetical protein
MELIKNIVIDIDGGTLTKIIAKQSDDKSRVLQFSIVNSGIPINLSGHTVKIYASKPDGYPVFNNATILDAVNGVISIVLTNQILAVSGDVQCELVILNNNNTVILSTKIFVLSVLPCVRNDQAIESSSEFTALQKALEDADFLIQKVELIDDEVDVIISEMNDKLDLANEQIDNMISRYESVTYIYVATTAPSTGVLSGHFWYKLI